MILVHAFPLSADQWLPDLHRVPRGWRFIAPDLRGFRGAGPAFESLGLEGISVDDYAADLLQLAQEEVLGELLSPPEQAVDIERQEFEELPAPVLIRGRR